MATEYHIAATLSSKLCVCITGGGSLLSVGGFPTATAAGTDLEGIARSSGVPQTATAHTVEAFHSAVASAIRRQELTTIVAKVEAAGPARYVTDLALLENRFQFSRYIQSRKRP